MIFLFLIITLAGQSLAAKPFHSHRVQKRDDDETSKYKGWKNLMEYFNAEYGPDPSELKSHPEENQEFDIESKEMIVEGDMIITEEQEEWTHEEISFRKARDDSKYYWPEGKVPYAIDPSSKNDEKIIEQAIRMWEENTCLTFPKVSRGSKGPHIFFAKKDGCTSHVGRVADIHPNGQQISIGPGCETVGIVAHEIGHAIGFYHEQSRTDRDDHIIILEKNIIAERKSNFDLRHNTDNQNTPYDVQSIMHYGPTSFSSNGNNTIVTIDPKKQFDIGQRKELSFFDIKMANIVYKCRGTCYFRITCYNDGYVDKNCRCRCPPDYGGNRCQYYQPRDSQCGFTTRRSGILTTPNWPSNYPSDSRCIWRILAPQMMHVEATFDEFDLRSKVSKDSACRSDRVEVRTHDMYKGDMYCGNDLKGKMLTSGNEMWIFFYSNYNNNKGFKATINFVADEY